MLDTFEFYYNNFGKYLPPENETIEKTLRSGVCSNCNRVGPVWKTVTPIYTLRGNEKYFPCFCFVCRSLRRQFLPKKGTAFIPVKGLTCCILISERKNIIWSELPYEFQNIEVHPDIKNTNKLISIIVETIKQNEIDKCLIIRSGGGNQLPDLQYSSGTYLVINNGENFNTFDVQHMEHLSSYNLTSKEWKDIFGYNDKKKDAMFQKYPWLNDEILPINGSVEYRYLVSL